VVYELVSPTYVNIVDPTPPAGSYDTTMRLSIALELPRILPPSKLLGPDPAVGLDPDLVLGHTIDDGRNAVSQADLFLQVTTDAAGGFSDWFVDYTINRGGSLAFLVEGDQRMQGVTTDLWHTASLQECLTTGVPPPPCTDFAEDAAGGNTPGTWTVHTQCNDGMDNDGDGLVDLGADPDCRDALDDSEWSQGGFAAAGSLVVDDSSILDLLPPILASITVPEGVGAALASGSRPLGGLAVGAPQTEFAEVADSGLILIPKPGASTLEFEALAFADGARLGTAVALGDFDGDGVDEAAGGAPGATVSGHAEAGVVRLMDDGGATTTTWSLDTAGVPGVAAAGDHFGSVLATGDFDKNGFTDLAIGVPDYDFGRGRVVLLRGGVGGLTAHVSDIYAPFTWGIPNQAGALFGSALTVGDFDCDGYDDLATGAPDDDNAGVDDGRVYVLYGDAAAPMAVGGVWHQNVPGVGGGAENGDRLGASLTSGDFDGDGCDDLVIGVPFEDINFVDDGMINILYGSGSGITTTNQRTNGQAGLDPREANDHFGEVLHAADVNDDGYEDLLVGVPDEDLGAAVDAGVVHILFGSASGLPATSAGGNQLWSQNSAGLATVAESGDAFGSALAVGWFDADSLVDLAVGAPGDGGSGSVLVLFDDAPDCADGVDNDGDGLVDFVGQPFTATGPDPGCSSATDATETDPALVCDDGIDNDGDGFTDFREDLDGDGISDPPGDPACKLPSWGGGETSECQDGVNNDGKFGTDWDGGVSAGQPADPDGHDPQCLNQPWKDREESGGRRCGLGWEVVFALTGVMALRRRR
jgi:hypothetical protein